jgi:hypothetical protein
VPSLESIGKLLLIMGGVIAAGGLILLFFGRFGLGRLPGDIVVQKERFVFYFPIVTMIVVSAVLTLLFTLLGRLFNR